MRKQGGETRPKVAGLRGNPQTLWSAPIGIPGGFCQGGNVYENEMQTYTFKVVVEPDEDRWHAYCPALIRQGGATWGHTPEEALKNIEDVVKMVVESLRENGESVPEGPSGQVSVYLEPLVAVTV